MPASDRLSAAKAALLTAQQKLAEAEGEQMMVDIGAQGILIRNHELRNRVGNQAQTIFRLQLEAKAKDQQIASLRQDYERLHDRFVKEQGRALGFKVGLS